MLARWVFRENVVIRMRQIRDGYRAFLIRLLQRRQVLCKNRILSEQIYDRHDPSYRNLFLLLNLSLGALGANDFGVDTSVL